MKTQNEMIGSCQIIPISELVVSPLNARQQNQESKDSEKFVSLCESIKSDGLIEPLVVRPVNGKYEIVAGTRRFAALKQIGAKQATTVVKQMSDNDVRIASLVENIHRNDLNEDEKEVTLREIYLTTWEEWRPADWHLRDYSSDENKIKLARSYLTRIHNVTTDRSGNKEQSVFPSENFQHLRARVGYAPSTQYNILRGYGAFSSQKDFFEELPPTIQEIVEKKAKEAKLHELEKQELSRRLISARKFPRQKPKKPKTKKQKAQEIADRFVQQKARKESKHKISQQRQQRSKVYSAEVLQPTFYQPEKQSSSSSPSPSPSLKAPGTEQRAREEILGESLKLFKMLTGEELNTSDEDIGEMQAKSESAKQTMKEMLYFTDPPEIALHQRIIIPLYHAISRYRDALYEVAESRHGKDNILRP